MTVASCEVNLQSKDDLICHAAKVKAATPVHSMVTQYLYSVFTVIFLKTVFQGGELCIEILSQELGSLTPKFCF